MPTQCDVLVVGGGFAGLAAANVLARQLHTAVVFDSRQYRNARTEHMHGLPTWDHKDPAAFRAEARKNILDNYDTIEFQDTRITTIKSNESGTIFEAIDDTGRTWEGRKVILATGVEDVYPQIPGYAECWVTGIFHCLVCHGYEERNSAHSGVLAIGDLAPALLALHFARMALRITPKQVTIYTNGSAEAASQIETELGNAQNIRVDSRQIKHLEKGSTNAEVNLHFEDGSIVTEGFLGHKPTTRLRADLWQQLGVEQTSKGHLRADPPFSQTNIRGVFSAGDAGSPIPTATQALFGGSLAAAGVISQLQAESLGQKGMI